MIPYIGDFAEDATVYHYFNTFSSDDPSASVTITNLADTDIYVYKDGSVTDLVTDGASVVIDFDSRTGVHKLTIDTSVHADYATGSDYMVLVEGTTIDGATVTAGIFTFSIENRYNDVNVASISGDATAADNLEASLETMLVGTATGGTTSTVTSALTGHGDDTFIGRLLIFRTGTCQYEAGTITDYDSTAGTFTFAASTWTTSPTTETFVIV